MKDSFHKKKKRFLIIYLTVLSLPVLLGYAATFYLFYDSEIPFHFYEVSSFFCLEHLDAVILFSCLLLIISIPFLLSYLLLLWKETRRNRFKDSLITSVFFCILCWAVFFQNVSCEQLLNFDLDYTNQFYFLHNISSADHAYDTGDYSSANTFYRLAEANIPDTDGTGDFLIHFIISKKKTEIEKGIRLSAIASAEEAALSSNYDVFKACYLSLIDYDPEIPALYERAADYSISAKNYLDAVDFLADGYQNTNSDSLKQKQEDLVSRLYLASVKSHCSEEPGVYFCQFFDADGTLRESYTKKRDIGITERKLFDENGELISSRDYYDDGTLYSVRTYQNGNCTFSCHYDTSGNVTDKSFRDYDENGYFISEHSYENTGESEVLVSERLCEYDQQQHIIRDEQFLLSSGTRKIELSEYNAEGRLYRQETSTYMDETLISQELYLYTYDTEGTVTFSQTYCNGKLLHTHRYDNTYEYDEKGQLTAYTSRDKYTNYTTGEEYDKDGNTISRLYDTPTLSEKILYEYDENHTLRKRSVYHDNLLYEVTAYDANGNTLSRLSYAEDGHIRTKEISTYNENGSLLISTSFHEESGKEATICQYNDTGNLTEEIFYRNGETTCTDYEYDALGSLTKKTVSYVNRRYSEVTHYRNSYELRQ